MARLWGLRAPNWMWRAEAIDCSPLEPSSQGGVAKQLVPELHLGCLLGLIPWELRPKKPQKHSCCGEKAA